MYEYKIKTTIPAQVLYNLREATGFISGMELHEALFDLTGEMSPSGYVEIDLAGLKTCRWGREIFDALTDLAERQVELSKRAFWLVMHAELEPQEKASAWDTWVEAGQPCEYLDPETQDVPYLIPIPIDPE